MSLPVYDVEELGVEHIHLLGIDTTQRDELEAFVANEFGGDWDLAVEAAKRHVQQFVRPELWAELLAGPRRGWMDPQSRRWR